MQKQEKFFVRQRDEIFSEFLWKVSVGKKEFFKENFRKTPVLHSDGSVQKVYAVAYVSAALWLSDCLVDQRLNAAVSRIIADRLSLS